MLAGLLYNLPITLLMYSYTCSLSSLIEYLINWITPSIASVNAYTACSFSSELSTRKP
jgi:hypothetical protein